MNKSLALVALAPFALAACMPADSGTTDAGFVQEIPERVAAIAAGGQDMTAVRLDPVDGCYSYRYVGPVETTFLPLRAKNGRPICTR